MLRMILEHNLVKKGHGQENISPKFPVIVRTRRLDATNVGNYMVVIQKSKACQY